MQQMTRRQSHAAPGFTRTDLIALMMVALAATSKVVVAGTQARLASGLGRSLANLHAQATGYAAYAADFDNQTATFTWDDQDGDLTPFQDLQSQIQQGGIAASAAQAVHIIRTAGNIPQMPVQGGWIPQPSASQIVLAGYLGEELPSRIFASPGDPVRLGWQDGTRPLPSNDDGPITRWLFSSSYELTPAFWYAEESVNPDSRITQGSNQRLFVVPSFPVDLNGRDLGKVSFPSNKVMVHESVQRFFGSRDVYWGYREARIPMLMVDGSTHVRVTGDANGGWDPRRPSSTGRSMFIYEPNEELGQPPALDPDSRAGVLLHGSYRWTRTGAQGRDFGPTVPLP